MSEIHNEGHSPLPSNVVEPRNHEDPAANEPRDDLADDTPEEKPGSTRDAIAKAFDGLSNDDKPELEDEAEKPVKEPKDAKPEKDEKPAEKLKAEEEKPQKADPNAKPEGEKVAAEGDRDEAGRDADKKQRQSEGRQFYEPPARFLPKAREAWANVPNVVKGEIDRISREHEQEVTQYRESHENWQKLAKFDQMAKQHNTSVSDALERYTAVDHILKNNPVEGIRQILQTVGLTPRQYAEHVLQNPQSHQAPQRPAEPDPVVKQTASEVETLRAEMNAMRQEQAAREIIDPFRRDNPRFDELQEDIAFFLNSGRVPQNLSPQERLAVAYDMAERLKPMPSSVSERQAAAPAAPEPEPVDDPRGRKSIKGAPSSGFDPAKNGNAKSRRDALSAAMAEYGI